MVFNPNNRRGVLEILDEVKTGKNKDRDLINDFAEVIKGYRGDVFELKQDNNTLLQ
jgi:hypothetical protein